MKTKSIPTAAVLKLLKTKKCTSAVRANNKILCAKLTQKDIYKLLTKFLKEVESDEN